MIRNNLLIKFYELESFPVGNSIQQNMVIIDIIQEEIIISVFFPYLSVNLANKGVIIVDNTVTNDMIYPAVI